MAEHTAILLADVESGHVETVAEPRAFPRRGVKVAAGLLGLTVAAAMWARGEQEGVVQGKVGAVVDLSNDPRVGEEEGEEDEGFASLDADHEKSLKDTFDAIDQDGDGSFDGDELEAWGKSLGEDAPRGEVDGMIRTLDKGNSKVDFDEFRAHPSAAQTVDYEMDLLETFGVFDKNADGEVEGDELEKALEGWGHGIEQDELDGILALGGGDDKKINYQEFKKLLQSEAFADKAKALQEILAENAEMDQSHEGAYKQTFDIVDQDKDSFISLQELGKWVKSHGLNPSAEDLKAMLAEVAGSDEKISLQEFESHPGIGEGVQQEMEVLETFDAFDGDKNGKVGSKEIKEAMVAWGESISMEEVDGIVGLADKDDDKKINYEEFKRLLTSEKGARMRDDLKEILAKQASSESEFGSEFQTVFDVIDKNKDGSITVEELQEYCSGMGQDFSKGQVQGIIAEVDEGDDKVDFDEFSNHPISQGAINLRMQMLKTFATFDAAPQDGFVTSKEVTEAFSQEGEPMTDEKAKKMIAEADGDADEKLDYEEFKKAFVAYPKA